MLPAIPERFASASRVMTGLDSLHEGLVPETVMRLRPARLGLLTNQTGLTTAGVPALQVVRDLELNLCALFSPEHGPQGVLQGDVESSVTPDGLPVHSLYGKSRRPTPEMFAEIDHLIVDLQDVGARFYTYFSTVANCLEVAAVNGVGVTILDRPNPLGGLDVQGPVAQPACFSFIGYGPLPVTHGLTLGELARWFATDKGLGLPVEVVPLVGWHREMHWPETGLPWRVPSPNLPHYESASWYPGLCLLEFSGVSVGRGTPWPFQIVAAPWLRPELLIEAAEPGLLELGISLFDLEVTPTHAVHENMLCRAVGFKTESDFPHHVVAAGLIVMDALHRTHAEFGEGALRAARPLLASDTALVGLLERDLSGVLARSRAEAALFAVERTPFLLY